MDKLTSNSLISKPEPKPEHKGIPIYPICVDEINNLSISENTKKMVIDLITQRYNFGLQKYGQPLMSEDGRNEIEDCLQEIGDAIQYLTKAKYNKKDISKLRPMIMTLYLMILEYD